jgi:hypothetical protein
VLANARRCARRPGTAASGRLTAAVTALDTVLGRATRLVEQTRTRARRHHPGVGDPAGVAARPGRPADRQGPGGQAGGVRLPVAPCRSPGFGEGCPFAGVVARCPPPT